MVISSNTKPNKHDFKRLLDRTVQELIAHAHSNPKVIEKLKGTKLEPYVFEIMTELAVGTPFEGSIELIGGQKFPDIIAQRVFGVEVKTTVKNHWKTTGNSVLESTRVEDVERIYILFAKLATPIEFRCKPYEECLSEVVVTHSPRYLIDMDLEVGQTIFDKLQVKYDILRQSNAPIKPIIKYYRSRLKPGQDLWWIDSGNDESSSLVVNVWNNLSLKERQNVKNKAMVYFPELFSGKADKFSRFSLWLVTRRATVCPNVRDLFTAGGKGDFVINGQLYENIPRVFINLFENISGIFEIIRESRPSELIDYWGSEPDENNMLKKWISLVDTHSKSLRGAKDLDINQMLVELSKEF